MALKKANENGGATYLQVVGGRFAQRVPVGTEDAVERELKMGPNQGQKIAEVFYESISGYITNTKLEDGDYGESISVTVTDGDDDIHLRLPWNSKLRDAFVKRTPSIDISKPVEFVCFPDKKDSSPVLLVKQGGNLLPMKWTKAEPEDMPPPEEVVVKGKKTLDWKKNESFLWDRCSEFCDQFEGDAAPKYQESVKDETEPESEEEEGPSEEDNSDIPF